MYFRLVTIVPVITCDGEQNLYQMSLLYNIIVLKKLHSNNIFKHILLILTYKIKVIKKSKKLSIKINKYAFQNVTT